MRDDVLTTGNHRFTDVLSLVMISAIFAGCGEDTVGAAAMPALDGGVPDGCTLAAVYPDRDEDSFGDSSGPMSMCGPPPPTFVLRAGDCDDHEATVHPGAPELCDGADNDCDGTADDAVESVAFFRDSDGDGFGDDGATVEGCVAPQGYVDRGGDCDDAQASAFPSAIELCDGVDSDCDGSVDEDALEVVTNPISLGAVMDGFRNLAVARDPQGPIAVWVTPDREVVAHRITPGQSLDGVSPAVLFTLSPPSIAHYSPAVAVMDGTLLVAWSELDGVHARAFAVDGFRPIGPPVRLSTGQRSGMPVAIIRVPRGAAVIWQERNASTEIFLREIDPARATPRGPAELVLEEHITSPSLYGPSIVNIDGMADGFLLADVDVPIGDETPSIFVHHVRMTPELEVDPTPTRIMVEGGLAPSRVILAPALGAVIDERSVLVLASWEDGEGPRSSAWRILPRAIGALQCSEPLGTAFDGFIVDAAPAPGGVDLLITEPSPLEGQRVSVIHQPLQDGTSTLIGSATDLLEGAWGSLAPRSDGRGLLLTSGRSSETDALSDVRAQRYGCGR